MPTVLQKGLQWACKCTELLSTKLEHVTQGMQDIWFVSWQVKGDFQQMSTYWALQPNLLSITRVTMTGVVASLSFSCKWQEDTAN